MTKPILTVTLNPVLDYVVTIPKLSDFEMSAGGKGINVSRALKNLGGTTVALGFLGGASGQIIKRKLQAEHLRSDFVKTGATRRSLTIIESPSAKITRFFENGPTVSRSSQKSFLKKFKTHLSHCQAVVISGRSAAGLPDSFCRDLITQATKRGIKTTLDTTGKAFGRGLEAAPFLIKPNLEEAQEFLKRKIRNRTELKKAARSFLKFGVAVVVISLGKRGALAASGNECWFAKAPKVKAQNTVGCGDAMLAGFIYEYFKSHHLGESLKTAVAAGTANALSLHPGKINRRQVARLRKKVVLQYSNI